MKRNFILTGIALCAVLCFTSCDENDKKPSKNNISGTWDIVDAVGVEWQENAGNTGAGTVIDTNDPDVDMIGETFMIEGSVITAFGDPYPFEYSDGVIVIDFGGDSESFNVEFDGSNTMIWTQDEPSAHSDYEENNPEQFLYYQKTFTLERQ
jgi:hypothetical protein